MLSSSDTGLDDLLKMTLPLVIAGEIIEGPRLFYPKPDEKSRFPKVYVTKEDVAALKHPLSKGITLLGFKAMDTLEHHHQLRPATFAYPDEATVKGSTRAFVALHSVLLERNMFALCLMVRGPSAEPRLVAAVPQVEEKTGGGAQLVPPGFNFIYLPYSDDVRALEKDPGFTGPERPQPSDAQVAAAATMIDALQLGTEFDPGAVPNPHVQRHFQVLECVALDEDCPEHVRDDAKPDEAAFNAAQPYILAFKVGGGSGHQLFRGGGCR